MSNETTTDCRSPEGKVVGLIDSVIGIFNVLPDVWVDSPEVDEAISDLLGNDFFLFLCRELEKRTLKSK